MAWILGNYEERLRPMTVVKIAGTNGKGSVAAMLDAGLRASGLRVGLFTSPHLIRWHERIRVHGSEIDPAWLDQLADQTSSTLDCTDELDDVPSIFERLLVLAFEAFTRAAVDVAILECAIGGQTDAVGPVPGSLSIVTSVGLDHCRELGPTLEAIATNKAGVASPGSVLVVGPSIDGDALHAVERRTTRSRVRLVRARRSAVAVGTASLRDSTALVKWGAEDRAIHLRLPLAGRFQLDNLATAVTALRELATLGLPIDARGVEGLAATRWPGRMERIDARGTRWLLDCAHNAPAMHALVEALDDLTARDQRVLLLGLADPSADHTDVLPQVPGLAARVHLVDGFHRAVSTHELERRLQSIAPGSITCVGRHTSPNAAIDALAGSNALIVAAGSTYLVGSLRAALHDESR